MENQKKKLFGLITLNKYGNPFKRKLFIFFMLLIPIANFLVFTVYANFGGIVLSFRQMSNSTGQEVFVGIANYKKFFEVSLRRDVPVPPDFSLMLLFPV